MLRECIYGECAHEQHVRRTLTLTLTHTITACSVLSGNVVRVRILICATRKKSVEEEFTDISAVICARDTHTLSLPLSVCLCLSHSSKYLSLV